MISISPRMNRGGITKIKVGINLTNSLSFFTILIKQSRDSPVEFQSRSHVRYITEPSRTPVRQHSGSRREEIMPCVFAADNPVRVRSACTAKQWVRTGTLLDETGKVSTASL